jgi:hypothetical protein
VLLFATDMEHSPLPEQAAAAAVHHAEHAQSAAEGSSFDDGDADNDGAADEPAEAVLLGGYARYVLDSAGDLAALLQLRGHMQLLLQMKVRLQGR